MLCIFEKNDYFFLVKFIVEDFELLRFFEIESVVNYL